MRKLRIMAHSIKGLTFITAISGKLLGIKCVVIFRRDLSQICATVVVILVNNDAHVSFECNLKIIRGSVDITTAKYKYRNISSIFIYEFIIVLDFLSRPL